MNSRQAPTIAPEPDDGYTRCVVLACLSLVLVSLVISAPVVAVMIRLGHRLSAFDSPGVAGQVKAARRKIPNTGGVGIFWGLTLPIAAGLVLLRLAPDLITSKLPQVAEHLPGIAERAPMALTLLACVLGLHVLGLIDDRKPMGPWIKMGLMFVAAAVVSVGTGSRLLTLLDAHVGSPWLSYLITILWIVAITNAMNFLDNMDGLSAGVGAIAASCFLAGTLIHGQWFIAACLALLIGALLGFLIFNFPPAKIFMGDGGSLIVGFMLAFLTVRTTYVESSAATPMSGNWYGVLMPVIVLAVPLYDFTTVTLLRVSQGKSPFVGDLQHVSHRMVERGLSRRAAVLVIWGLTAVTGLGGVALAELKPWQAVLVGVQTLAALGVLAAFEFSKRGRADGDRR